MRKPSRSEGDFSNEFTGKVACMTGASRGIGAATGIALARAGVRHVELHDHSHLAGAEKTLCAIRKLGGDGELVCADLATARGIHEFVEGLESRKLEIDILVNNAGALIKRATLVEYPENLFDQVMTLNVKSVWLVTQAVVPQMIRRSSGVIVNVSSIAARNGGSVGATVYASAKAAVSAMTKGLARELAPRGIRVNGISPGRWTTIFTKRFRRGRCWSRWRLLRLADGWERMRDGGCRCFLVFGRIPIHVRSDVGAERRPLYGLALGLIQ